MAENKLADLSTDFAVAILKLTDGMKGHYSLVNQLERSAVVSALTVECDNADCAFFSDGCLMLLPGEEAEIRVEGQSRETLRLYLSGFGVPYQKLCVI